MKNITYLLLVVISQVSTAQNKMIATSGQIIFEASVPFFEPIKATDSKVMVTYDPKTQMLECVSYIRNFNFELPLMQRQFNENYMESNRYPKAVFKGKIENFVSANADLIPKEYTLTGKMQLHGKSKIISVKAIIQKNANGILLTSHFILDPTDFKIEIPSTIAGKIAKTVTTNLAANLQ
ncbi:YceI family protein [Flavobacterium sp. TMP13]|uniref:YceI family protein n=1 Tax=Flavobacterium sp. TMP13 TaxID=3425950 RepID=UPI003D779D49